MAYVLFEAYYYLLLCYAVPSQYSFADEGELLCYWAVCHIVL